MALWLATAQWFENTYSRECDCQSLITKTQPSTVFETQPMFSDHVVVVVGFA